MFLLLPIKSVVLSKETVQEIITVMFVNKHSRLCPRLDSRVPGPDRRNQKGDGKSTKRTMTLRAMITAAVLITTVATLVRATTSDDGKCGAHQNT